MWRFVEKTFFARMINDITTYFSLYDFIKVKAKQLLHTAIEINNEEAFWYNILGDNFYDFRNQKYLNFQNGQILKFKDFFLTEWSPKIPGQIWTKEGHQQYERGTTSSNQSTLIIDNKMFTTFHPYEKGQIVSAGYGSIRINPSNNSPENYMLMTLVSKNEHWHTDYGIPAIVSKSVYENWLNYSKKGAPWIPECEGILVLNRDIPLSTYIPNAIGSKLSEELEDILRFKPNLPKCFIYFPSILSIKFKHNDSHPTATAWTLYESEESRDKLQYTYIGFHPYNIESEETAVDFIKAYINKHKGKRIITDFDGIKPRLEAEIPINTNPIVNHKESCQRIFDVLSEYKKSVDKYYG